MGKDTIRISKCDAAKRQLRTAIRIWFANGDPVAVHTLAFAAYEVLHSISVKRDPNRNPVLIFDSLLIEEERRREWNQLMRKEANFFKHADRDGDLVIEFNPEVSLFFIFFAIIARDDCGEPDSDEESAFIVWLRLNRPKMFSEEVRKYFKRRAKGHNVAQLRALTRNQFFKLWRTTLPLNVSSSRALDFGLWLSSCLELWMYPWLLLRSRLAVYQGGAVGQPFADDALQSFYRAVLIVNAKRDAVGVAEVKLRQVAMQVLLLAMLIDALHAALENRIVALDRVSRDGGGFNDRLAIRTQLVGDFQKRSCKMAHYHGRPWSPRRNQRSSG